MPLYTAQSNDGFLPAPVRAIAPYFLLALLVFIFYGNIYDNSFVYDDQHLIAYNQYLQSWNTIGLIFSHKLMAGAGLSSSFYRPLQIVLYLLVYQLFGSSPFGFHLLNIALHAANTCLLYALGRKLKFEPIATFFAALLWGLHPMHTEAITYMSGTGEPLYVFFSLLGLLVLVPTFKTRTIVLASFLFILALLSKEAALVFPALATLCLFFKSDRRKDFRTYFCLWPLWSIAIIYAVLHLALSGVELFDPTLKVNASMQSYATHFLFRLYTFLAALPTYLKIMIWPTDLHMDRAVNIYRHFWNIDVAAGALMMVAAILQIFWNKSKNWAPLSWGLMWWGIAFSPQAGLVMPMLVTIREHWLYLPSMGLFLGAAQNAAIFSQRYSKSRLLKYTMIIGGSGIALTLGVSTYNQNQIWQTPLTLYSDIVKYNPSPLMLSNLGNAYIQNNDFDKALVVLHRAISIDDINPEAHMNLAYLYLLSSSGKENLEKAIGEANRALELDPNFLPAVELLADIYEKIGNTEQAAIYKTRAEKIKQKLMQ